MVVRNIGARLLHSMCHGGLSDDDAGTAQESCGCDMQLLGQRGAGGGHFRSEQGEGGGRLMQCIDHSCMSPPKKKI